MLQATERRLPRVVWLVAGLLSLVWFIVYLATVSPGVNFIDSGELVTTAYEPGIAHPPGYPLYVLMGYVVTHLLWGEVAWRLNVLSAFWGAAAVGMLFLLVIETTRYILAQPLPKRVGRTSVRRGPSRSLQPPAARKPVPEAPPQTYLGLAQVDWLYVGAAAAAASLLGASATFWSRTAQAKMYTLHYFFVVALVLAALKAREALDGENASAATRWLVVTAAGLGLSLTNHLMTSLLVVPLVALLLIGPGVQERFRAILHRWFFLLPAVLVPLLLYLYLPIRSSQDPLMNWGTPNTWGDFWRHIEGWQYHTYLFQDFGVNVSRVWDFMLGQWSVLTVLVILGALAVAVLLARVSPVLFTATLLLAVMTVLFAFAYGISEIEPYMVPLYIVFAMWIGLAPAALRRFSLLARQSSATPDARREALMQRVPPVAVGLAGLFAVVTAVLVYPGQNHRNDHLAPQFANNVFSEMPQNSILITDYWDFYAPTIYLQTIDKVRPDIAIVDTSLLTYPWYMGHLQKQHPWLVDNSRDLASAYQVLQRRWVNGENLSDADISALDKSYFDLLTSFVTKNEAAHPAYTLFQPPCDANPVPAGCRGSQVAPAYSRQRVGITTKLWQGSVPQSSVPPEPHYQLQGIADHSVPMDEFAKNNTQIYVSALTTLADRYQNAGMVASAERMLQQAAEVRSAIGP